MADVSGRADLSVGDVAEAGAHIRDYTAGAAITKGQAVYFSGALTVAPTTNVGLVAAGIALKTVSSGEVVPVLVKGVVKATAAGAIGVGKTVGTAANGKVAVLTVGEAPDVTDWDEILGKNIGGAATSDGDLVLIAVNLP